MTTRRRRRAVIFATAVLAVLASMSLAPQPASAGGSGWDFDRPFYEPGDIFRATAPVGWDNLDPSGRTIGGPFGAWIEKFDEDPAPDVALKSYAERVEWARYVADVRFTLGSEIINGVYYGPNLAHLEFRLPRVEPGLYVVLTCNYPCTATVGIGGGSFFWVGPPDPPAPVPAPAPPTTAVTLPPTTAVTLPPTTAATATQTAARVDDDDSGGPPTALIAVGLVALAGGVAVATTRHRRGRLS
jgi:hypothetical protein